MKKLFLLTALFVAAAFPSCSKHDGVETPDWPEPQPLAIAFAEGNELFFGVDETKTVHYTITGGSDNTVVKVEMQNPDDAYTVETTPASATEGTITITAKMPSTDNCVIVTVSDGSQTLTAEIAVSTNPRPQGITITVDTPGTLAELLADYDKSSITELTVIGNLNSLDIRCLNSNLRNLAILDMEHVNWEELPQNTFYGNKSLTFVKLPLTLKTIGNRAFSNCSGLTSVTIPDSVTEICYCAFSGCRSLTSVTIGNSVKYIENYAFDGCSGLTSVTIGNSVTFIDSEAFRGCSSLTRVYCKAIVPPIIVNNTFDKVSATATLYVPTGCKAAYAAATEWSKFKTIEDKQASSNNITLDPYPFPSELGMEAYLMDNPSILKLDDRKSSSAR